MQEFLMHQRILIASGCSEEAGIDYIFIINDKIIKTENTKAHLSLVFISLYYRTRFGSYCPCTIHSDESVCLFSSTQTDMLVCNI